MQDTADAVPLVRGDGPEETEIATMETDETDRQYVPLTRIHEEWEGW